MRTGWLPSKPVFLSGAATESRCGLPSGAPGRDVPRSKKSWTEMDRATFPFKTGPVLSCFFCLSIPILNGLSNRSKRVWSFGYPIFPVSSLSCLSTRLKNYMKTKLYHFLTEINRFLPKTDQRYSAILFFSVKWSFLPVKYLSSLSIDSDWTGLNGRKRLELGLLFPQLSSFKCSSQSILSL